MAKGKHGYRSIFETLRREVLDGKYDASRSLPSEWQLARRFGVCRPTVSRSILEMVREGLVVCRQGAPTTLTRFAQNASGVIGLILQGEWNYEDLYPSICRRLMTIAERSGWRMVRCDIARSTGRARVRAIQAIIDRLVSERVTGVFLQPVESMPDSASFNAKVVARLRAASIHVVLLDYDITPLSDRSDCDLVGVDNFAAGHELGTHLLGRGAERLAFLKEPFLGQAVADRLRGLAAAVLDAGLRWRPDRDEMLCDPDAPYQVAAFLKDRRPDAIVAYNDKAALRLARTLAALGRVVPRDVMLAGFDDIPAAAVATPPLTTMRQPVHDIAAVAFHTLVSRIRQPDLPPRKTLLACRMVARDSTLG